MHQKVSAWKSIIGIALSLAAAALPCLAQEEPEATLAADLSGCPAAAQASTPQELVVQGFPSAQGAPVETAWCVRWRDAGPKGLRIAEAWLKRSAGEPWLQILGEAGLVEIFVPYHNGLLRPRDLHFGHLQQLLPTDLGPSGVLLGTKVAREVRDRGIAWESDCELRRGEELLLWSTLEVGNYDYIIEYGFRDDGTVAFRVGATGFNNPNLIHEGHMHDALWRVNVNLDGAAHDSAFLTRHVEIDPGTQQPTLEAVDTAQALAVETTGVWKPREFTTIRVEDTQRKNANGRPIGYELLPLRSGTSRHVEAFTRFDFAVLAADGPEAKAEADDLPGLDDDQQPVANADLSLWYTSSAHHDPHDEDLPVTHVRWSGFDFVPHDLFDSSPLVRGCRASRRPDSLLTDVRVVPTFSPISPTAKTILAICPTGLSLLGGGARILPATPGVSLRASLGFPFLNPTGWLATAVPLGAPPGVGWRLISFAICGKAAHRQPVRVFNSSMQEGLSVAAACPCGTAVLGGGARIRGTGALGSSAPQGPACPNLWEALAREVPASPVSTNIEQVSVICGNVPGYEVVSEATALDSTDPKTAVVACPPGKVVLGGGAFVFGTSDGVALRASAPSGGNRWAAQAFEAAPQVKNWGIRVDAVCACFPGPCPP